MSVITDADVGNVAKCLQMILEKVHFNFNKYFYGDENVGSSTLDLTTKG